MVLVVGSTGRADAVLSPATSTDAAALADTVNRPAGTRSVQSDALCLEAVSAYTRLFRRSRVMEPDAGVAHSYVSGSRALEAFARVPPWAVPTATVEEATRLLRRVEGVSEEQVDEWVDLFPPTFLETIDRRRGSTRQVGPLRRRFRDRVLCAPVRRSPGQSR